MYPVPYVPKGPLCTQKNLQNVFMAIGPLCTQQNYLYGNHTMVGVLLCQPLDPDFIAFGEAQK